MSSGVKSALRLRERTSSSRISKNWLRPALEESVSTSHVISFLISLAGFDYAPYLHAMSWLRLLSGTNSNEGGCHIRPIPLSCSWPHGDWSTFYAVIYMTDQFLTRHQVEAEWRMTGVPHTWRPILVTGRGHRLPKRQRPTFEPAPGRANKRLQPSARRKGMTRRG